MTLAELTTALQTNLLDNSGATPDFWTTARSYEKLNAAMRYVASLLVAARPAHLYVDQTVTLANAGSAPWVLATLAAPYAQVRQLVQAARVGYAGGPGFLARSDLERVHSLVRGSTPLELPPYFLFGTSIGFVYPKDAIQVKLVYVPALLDMTAGTDTPGQAGGTGTANLVPTAFHPLIVLRATTVCLAAMGLPTLEFKALLNDEIQALGLSVAQRRHTGDQP